MRSNPYPKIPATPPKRSGHAGLKVLRHVEQQQTVPPQTCSPCDHPTLGIASDSNAEAGAVGKWRLRKAISDDLLP